MKRGCWLLAGVLVAVPAAAVPDLQGARALGALTVYPDDRRATLYYYGPGEIAVALDADGRPDLHLLQTRYTGNAAAGDRGTIVFRSLLSVRVVQQAASPQELESARRALGAAVELRPVPIQRLEAALVYAAVGADAPPAPAGEDARPLPGGHFESADGEAAGAFWSERTYVLALGPEDAQLFWDALQHGRVALSLGYAFFALGTASAPPVLEVAGPAALGDALRRRVTAAARPPGPSPALAAAAPAAILLRAGATAVTLDAQRWPELLRRVDVNDSLPPGYAALDVYCYDFNNLLRPDLYGKLVDLEAEGVAGGRIALATTFQAAHPDLYARSLRFPVAVRLDRPYRYRVTEVGLDGTSRSGAWTAADSWNHVLDVTSAPAEPSAGPAAEVP